LFSVSTAPVCSSKGDLLLLFFCILATFVDEAHVARPPFFAYASIENTVATYHDLTGEKPDG